jgi:hypothetical protein
MLRVELEKDESFSYLYLLKQNVFLTIDSLNTRLKTCSLHGSLADLVEFVAISECESPSKPAHNNSLLQRSPLHRTQQQELVLGAHFNI